MSRALATLGIMIAGTSVWPACTLDFDIPGEVERSCKTGQDCSCADEGTCTFSCGSGACAPVCRAGSSCSISCGSGTCATRCEANATCDIDCGSGVCQVQCDGTCKVSCGSGLCSCSGPGCP
ncbi:MAG: hypothetical protein KIT84_26565 [Labilithrix sp.]|nr:hypothetical protein [Labilithrix sp.]MCW5814617.1 hypothetical protein [Labilithrix sp.]